MTDSQRTGRFSGHARLVTVASILAVGTAGAVAVGANIGILDAADTSSLGGLAAAGDLTTPQTTSLTTPEAQVIDVYIDDPAPVTTTAAPDPRPIATPAAADPVQEFEVDAAGTVSVASTDTGIRVDDVSPAGGWTWKLVQPSPTELTVSFTNASRNLEFVASAMHGAIEVSVNEIIAPAPIVTTNPPVPAAAPPVGGGDDDDEAYEDDSHGDYEGGEDDD